MFIRVLGEIGAGPDPSQVQAAPGKVAAGVLAHLVLAKDRLVSTELLIDQVWDDPPTSARNAVQVAVSKLRSRFGPQFVISTPAGYRMPLATVRVDLWEVTALCEQARADIDSGAAALAVQRAGSAVALFTGAPFAGLDTFAAAAAQQRAAALWADARRLLAAGLVASGAIAEALSVLQELVTDRPLDEGAHASLMQALAAVGRAADALSVYDQLRHRLSEELGTDPDPAVQALFSRLLDPDQDHGFTVAELTMPVGLPPPPGRLPAAGAPLIGRDDELTTLLDRVRRGQRLITLVGPGGMGKTRLATEAARVLASDGRRVAFADLTATQEPGEVRRVVESALTGDGLALEGALAPVPTLVVLDNAEHVLAATAHVALAMLAVPGTTLLVTSRSPLQLRDEQVVWLDVLPVEGEDSPALRLLGQRAGLDPTAPGTPVAALLSLARRAEGVPLALELLGAALHWVSATQLDAEYEARLFQIRDDAADRPARHASMAAATDWSLAQLSDPQRTALGALTVTRGTFDLAAARELTTTAVPGADPAALITALVDASLIARSSVPGVIRFRILEPIRTRLLQADGVPAPSPVVRAAFARYFLHWVHSAVVGAGESTSDLDALLGQDDANVTAALNTAWAADPTGTAGGVLADLLWAWYTHGRYADVIVWAERGLATVIDDDPTRARIALILASALQYLQREPSRWPDLAQAAAESAASFEDRWHTRWVTVNVNIATAAGEHDEALRLQQQGLRGSVTAGQPHREDRGRQDRAHRGGTQTEPAWQRERANLLLRADRYTEAAEILDDLLRDPHLDKHPLEHVRVCAISAWVALSEGDPARAARLFTRGQRLCNRPQLEHTRGYFAIGHAWVALTRGEAAGAIRHLAGIERIAAIPRYAQCGIAALTGHALSILGNPRDSRWATTAAIGLAAHAGGFLYTYERARLTELTRLHPDAAPLEISDDTLARLHRLVRVSATELPD